MQTVFKSTDEKANVIQEMDKNDDLSKNKFNSKCIKNRLKRLRQ